MCDNDFVLLPDEDTSASGVEDDINVQERLKTKEKQQKKCKEGQQKEGLIKKALQTGKEIFQEVKNTLAVNNSVDEKYVTDPGYSLKELECPQYVSDGSSESENEPTDRKKKHRSRKLRRSVRNCESEYLSSKKYLSSKSHFPSPTILSPNSEKAYCKEQIMNKPKGADKSGEHSKDTEYSLSELQKSKYETSAREKKKQHKPENQKLVRDSQNVEHSLSELQISKFDTSAKEKKKHYKPENIKLVRDSKNVEYSLPSYQISKSSNEGNQKEQESFNVIEEHYSYNSSKPKFSLAVGAEKTDMSLKATGETKRSLKSLIEQNINQPSANTSDKRCSGGDIGKIHRSSEGSTEYMKECHHKKTSKKEKKAAKTSVSKNVAFYVPKLVSSSNKENASSTSGSDFEII